MKLFIALCFWGISSAALCQDLVTLQYYERPPFLIRQPDGGAAGLIGARVAHIMERAGIPFRWVLTPAKRQLHLILADSEATCGVGWYKTPQRAGFALFTRPIYRDRGTVVIANLHSSAERYKSLAELLGDKSMTLLVKDGLTYGATVAQMITTARARFEPVTIEQPQMVRLVARGRAQAMFATREEAEMLLTGSEEDDQGVRQLSFPDLPRSGEPRYLMCSRSLGAARLARIDSAIEETDQPYP